MNDTTQQEMPKYNSKEQVWALLITGIVTSEDKSNENAVLHLEGDFSPIEVDREYMMLAPEVGGYYVKGVGETIGYLPADELANNYGLVVDVIEKDKEPIENADGMIETQDPKYSILNNQLANTHTGEYIPSNEPVFIFRAKDSRAYDILSRYRNLCTDQQHKESIEDRMVEFDEFRNMNELLMGEPDTLTGADCDIGDSD